MGIGGYYSQAQTQAIEVCGTVTVADIAKFAYFNSFRRLWPLILLGLIVLTIDLAFFAAGNVDTGLSMGPLSLLVLFWIVIPYLSARRRVIIHLSASEALRGLVGSARFRGCSGRLLSFSFLVALLVGRALARSYVIERATFRFHPHV